MAYKYRSIDLEQARKGLTKPQILLKIIPHVEETSPEIAQLVCVRLQVDDVLGAWEGPARIQMESSACAPIAALPIRRILGGKHILANITLPYGEVVHDYVKDAQQHPERVKLTVTNPEDLLSLPMDAQRVMATSSM